MQDCDGRNYLMVPTLDGIDIYELAKQSLLALIFIIIRDNIGSILRKER